MGDNYEDLVELGFEGIDRFANKYHDVVYGYADKTRKKEFGNHRSHGQHHHPQDVGAPLPPPPPPPVDVNAPIPPPPPPPPPPFQAPPQPYGDEEEWQNVEKQRAMSDPRIRYAGPVPMPVPSPMAGASAGQGPGGEFGPRVEPPPSPWGIRGGNEALPRGPPSPQHRERGYDRRSREREPPFDEDDEEEKVYWATERERPRHRRRRSPSWSPPRRRSEPRYDEPPPPRRREVRSKSISRSKSKSPSRGLGSGAEATVAAVLAGGIVALGARGVVELYDRRQERKARGSRQRERERRRSVW